VVLLFGNQIIDVIKGVPDEPTLQRFMGILHRMSDAQDLMIHNLRFRTLMDENLVEGAREYVQHVNDCYIMQLIQDPKMSAKLGTLHLWVAATYISENKVDEGREQLRIVETTYAKQLAENQKDKDLHSDLTEWLNQLGKSGADVDPLLIEMLQQLDTDPKNLELRYKIAEHCNSINYHEEAIR
jgi:thioredoxin-like negative regulator of GroEL